MRRSVCLGENPSIQEVAYKINQLVGGGCRITAAEVSSDGLTIWAENQKPPEQLTEPPLPNPLRNYLGDDEDDGPPPAEPPVPDGRFDAPPVEHTAEFPNGLGDEL